MNTSTLTPDAQFMIAASALFDILDIIAAGLGSLFNAFAVFIFATSSSLNRNPLLYGMRLLNLMDLLTNLAGFLDGIGRQLLGPWLFPQLTIVGCG